MSKEQILMLGQQMDDTSYFVGYNAKKEAIFLFLENAEDIKNKGLMTHNDAIKTFKNSKGFNGHNASAYQTLGDIRDNATDGGIRQFTEDEWEVIMDNLMGEAEGITQSQQTTMQALWAQLKDVVKKQGDDCWVHTASSWGGINARFLYVHSGTVSSGHRNFGLDVVVSGRSVTQEQLPQYRFSA